LFVDEYTREYSRDCEPMRGGHTDNYYYQLASWVRKFKGVREQPLASGPARIDIDGVFDDWKDVRPEFRDTIDDITHRDHKGYGDMVYRNDTGRNDFVLCKCAYDATNVYFYAQTLAPITPYADTNWMLLFLDTDRNAATGWLGYDYVVNLEVPTDRETTLKTRHSGQWQTVARIPYRMNGNGLELAIPRDLIQQTNSAPAFDFHWADNCQASGDISEFGVNGDSAPNRRWNYRYAVLAPDARNANHPSENRHSSIGKDWDAPWKLADAFHLYGVEWDPEDIKYYVDGVLVRQVQNTHWHQPLYLIFDSETMPDWFGMPEDKDLPSTFSIEYVRAWKHAEMGTPQVR
jgi:hypothetical protein